MTNQDATNRNATNRRVSSPPALLVVGQGVVAAGLAGTVVALAERHRLGVLNSYLAKGIFAFDHPAHLGTVGLQRDDLVVAGVHEVIDGGGTVVVSGADELAGVLPDGVLDVTPVDLARTVRTNLAVSDHWPGRTPLYNRLAAVCGPAYGDDGIPLSPVRAAGDLATWLPDDAVVVADSGVAGFWLARTFPTRRPGSVRLPAGIDAGFVERVVTELVADHRRVVVIAGPALSDSGGAATHQAVQRPVLAAAAAAGGVVVIEHWATDGPAVAATDRVAALDQAMNAGGGELSVGVRLWELDAVEDVAGPVVAWGGLTGPPDR